MLTDAILKDATAEAERFRLSIVPEGEEPHVFSKRFERKMEKLIHRTNHPIRYQVMRVAAAVALAIVTLFGAVMAVSPEARAAVVGWIRETFGVYTHYSHDTHSNDRADSDDNTTASSGADSDADAQEPTKYEYRLAVIPDGYVEISVIEKIDGRMYVYVNDLGHILQFSYTYQVDNNNLWVETENYEQHSAFVNGLAADIFIAPQENKTSVIVWQDYETNILFQITAIASKTDLVEIAETVVKNNL